MSDGGEGGKPFAGERGADAVGGADRVGEVKTPFETDEDLDSMKAMLADAKPEQVFAVAEAWEEIHGLLVNGGGSVKGDFDRIVEHVLEHWEGESAEVFARAAAKISKQLGDCGTYARYTSAAMRNAGERLSYIKPKVEALGKRRDLGAALNRMGAAFMGGGRKLDAGFRGDIGEMRAARSAREGGADGTDGGGASGSGGSGSGASGGGGDERSKAVALMVDLALTYNSQTQAMSSWERKLPPTDGREVGDYPGEPGGFAPVAGPPAAVRSASRPVPRAASASERTRQGAVPGDDGVTGGNAARRPAPSPAGAAPGRTPVGRTSAEGAAAVGMSTDGVSGVSGGTGTAAASSAGGASSGTSAAGGITAGPGFAGPASGNGGAGRADRAGRAEAPAGFGAGAGRSRAPGRSGPRGEVGGAAGTGGVGDAGGGDAGAAAGRSLHFSRGGALGGERGRGEGAARGAARHFGGVPGGSADDGAETKYSRRPQGEGTGRPAGEGADGPAKGRTARGDSVQDDGG